MFYYVVRYTNGDLGIIKADRWTEAQSVAGVDEVLMSSGVSERRAEQDLEYFKQYQQGRPS